MTPNLTIRVDQHTRNKVELIAQTLDYSYGGKGSIAKLLKAIADNEIIISKNFSNKP